MAGAFKTSDMKEVGRSRKLHTLHDAASDTDYWADNLLYDSGSDGKLSYCTKAAARRGVRSGRGGNCPPQRASRMHL